jgi:hypothetical protein
MEKKKLNARYLPGWDPPPCRVVYAFAHSKPSGDFRESACTALAAVANMLPSAHVNCPEVVPFPNYESDMNQLIITYWVTPLNHHIPVDSLFILPVHRPTSFPLNTVPKHRQ